VTAWPAPRPAWVEVDLDAIAGNVRTLRAEVAPARLLAVVKADA
jgi:alanine racemase